jgi:tripartite ATP-independent transporter DctM subunit
MASGMPVAIAFVVTNIIGALIFTSGFLGLLQIVENSTGLITSYTLAPVPLFILMGALFFHTGLAHRVFDALDKLLGRIPGRLAFIAVGGGTIFSTLTGNTLANAAMLGGLVTPEMQRRGYSRKMSLGPVLGTGGLAMIIPPSGLAVLLGSVANIDVGKLLVAGVIPGFVLAFLYFGLIVVQLWRDPESAPPYEVEKVAFEEKMRVLFVNIVPMSLIILMVVGFILLGIVTPSESAAFGALAVIILGILYRQLSWKALKLSLTETMKVTGMVLFIIMGSTVFSNLLAYSGASRGLLDWATGFDLSPLVLLLVMFVILLLLGMFMDQVSMMLITVPIFFPLAKLAGFDPIWFGIIMLLAMEMSLTTPPFGLLLYVVMGIAPPGTKLGDVISAAMPYLICDAILLAILVALPPVALYLPGLMQ